MCPYVELHSDKCHDILRYSLKYQFDESPFAQSETSITIKQISKCKECISNENICWFHAESLKSGIIADVQNWIKDCKKFKDKDFK